MIDLQTLSLKNNWLNGSLPFEWSHMRTLSELDLSGNQLRGPLPPDWSSVTTLTRFNVSGNRLNGPLPPQWGSMQIYVLDISDNELSGSLPSEWGNLTRLTELHVGGNQLSGSLSPCAFRNWNVTWDFTFPMFNFSFNQFRGKLQLPCLPSDPCSGESRKSLNELLLNGNHLCGVCSIPCQCVLIANSTITSPNLTMLRVASSAECCSACAHYPTCVASVYHRDSTYCELKGVASPTSALPNADVLVLSG